MREYKLLISHVGKDKEIAMECVKALDITVEEGENSFKIVPVYMESETNGCFGDFAVWTENAVKSCDGVLAIITENTAETKVSADGIYANVKVVYDEISLARGNLKDIVVLRKNGVDLEAGYNLRLENVKCEFYDSKLDIAIANIVTDVILHAKRRFAGHPLLEYAGKVAVRLKPSVVPNTSAYLGREDKLKEIEDCFKNNKRVVCITGFGGIGKTTLAKMYADKHREEPVVIQYCSAEETSLKNAVVSLSMEYDSPEFDKMTIDERYDLRLRQLGNLDTQTLIIIDNFNADFGTVSNREVLAELSSMQKCKFIISSRQTLNSNEVGVVNVGKLNDEELVELFYRISDCERTEENNQCIKKLIECTNGHTMTIELSAKAVAIDENAVTLQEIVDSFLYSDALTHVQDRHDGYDEYETIYEHLRKLFNLSNIGDNEKKLLGALSFVARRGLTIKELKENFEYNKKELIRLVNLGYIAKSQEGTDTYYSLHPLLSELAFNDFVQSAEGFENIIEFLIYDKSQITRNDTVADLDMRIDYAEHIFSRLSTISNKTLFVRRSVSISCGRLGDIAQAKGDFKIAEEYYIQGYELRKAIMEATGTIESRRDLSVSCNKLGDIAQANGDLKMAEKYYIQGYELAKAIKEETGTVESRRDLSISCERLGDIAQANGNLEMAEEYYIQGYELRKGIKEETETIESRRDLSISCEKLGDIARAKGDLKTAEEYFIQKYKLAKAIVEETGTIESRRDLFVSCEKLGDIVKANGNLEMAEEYYIQGDELAKAIVEETGSIGSRRDLSISCNNLGDIEQTNGNLEMAEKYYIQGYELRKVIKEETGTIESRRDLSVSCNNLGDIAQAKGDLEMAENYYIQDYELSKEIMEETGTIESRRELSVSYERLGEIAQANGNLEMAEEYYIQGYELRKAIMEETGTILSRQDLSISCERLGNIARANGDLETAEKYYIQDYELVKAIMDETETIESRRDLSVSCNKLGDIAQANGDLKMAEKYYIQGYELAKVIMEATGTIESRRSLSISYERLGNIAQAKGDLKTAEDHYTQGYELRKAIMEATGTIESRRDLSVSYEKLGDIAQVNGDLEMAEKYYIQGYELRKAIMETTGTIESYDDLLISYYRFSTIVNSYAEKKQYLCVAFEIAEILFKNNVDYNERYRVLAQVLAELYKDAGEIEEYNKMKEILESLS